MLAKLCIQKISAACSCAVIDVVDTLSFIVIVCVVSVASEMFSRFNLLSEFSARGGGKLYLSCNEFSGTCIKHAHAHAVQIVQHVHVGVHGPKRPSHLHK